MTYTSAINGENQYSSIDENKGYEEDYDSEIEELLFLEQD